MNNERDEGEGLPDGDPPPGYSSCATSSGVGSRSHSELSEEERHLETISRVDSAPVDDEEFSAPQEEEHGEEKVVSVRRRILYSLYLSHLFSAVGDRMWQFAVPITFTRMFPGTLFPAALFIFVSKLTIFLFASVSGNAVDRFPRLPVVFFSLLLQNLSVIACAAVMFALFLFEEESRLENVLFLVLFAVLLGFGGLSELFSVASNIAVEKDWVCVVTKSSERVLTRVNGTVRRINLVCALVSPSIFGVLVDLLSTQVALLVVMIWNAVSFVPEFGLLFYIYWSTPELKVKKKSKKKKESEKPKPKSRLRVVKGGVSDLLTGFVTYVRHPAYLCSISFVLLWFTLADFGVLMTAYMDNRWNSKHTSLLGVLRGVGAIMGIFGTYLFGFAIKRVGISSASLLSVWGEFFLLCPAVLAFVLPGVLLDITLLTSVTLSRIGLYAFDIGETQIMQRLVEPEQRGVINSIQTGLCNLMVLSAFLCGMLIHETSMFGFLIFLSTCSVLASSILYTMWATGPGRYPDVRVKLKREKRPYWKLKLRKLLNMIRRVTGSSKTRVTADVRGMESVELAPVSLPSSSDRHSRTSEVPSLFENNGGPHHRSVSLVSEDLEDGVVPSE